MFLCLPGQKSGWFCYFIYTLVFLLCSAGELFKSWHCFFLRFSTQFNKYRSAKNALNQFYSLVFNWSKRYWNWKIGVILWPSKIVGKRQFLKIIRMLLFYAKIKNCVHWSSSKLPTDTNIVVASDLNKVETPRCTLVSLVKFLLVPLIKTRAEKNRNNTVSSKQLKTSLLWQCLHEFYVLLKAGTGNRCWRVYDSCKCFSGFTTVYFIPVMRYRDSKLRV